MFYKIENENMIGEWSVPPTNGVEITEEEYNTLKVNFEERGKNLTLYVQKIQSGDITLEDVPEEYRQEVSDIVNSPEPEQYSEEYLAGYDQAILDMMGV